MNKKSKFDIDWAEIADIFASEYGWTIEYTASLSLHQAMLLMDKIQKRRDKLNGISEGETPPTKVEGVISEESKGEVPMSYFENMGKKVVEDGITKIII